MRLVKQVSLFFREGNSDKVYEIDLCDIGSDRYVVNFRYGRRGTVLKEGTKTETGVNLEKAESIFISLEEEKRAKGYRTANEPLAAEVNRIREETIAVPLPVINWNDWPQGRKKAILQRLQLAVEGKENTANHFWKTSRIIWMAGVMKLEAATPFIIHLAAKSDVMQQYASAWALGRIGQPDAIPLLQSFFKSAPGSNLKRIAGEALLHVLKGEEHQKHLQHYVNSLPEPVKAAVESKNDTVLNELLEERVVQQTQPHYSVVEDLYTIAIEYKWVRQSLKTILLQLPLKPNYFKHIRHIYKLAEFRNDFETIGILSRRFEREQEMFGQKANIGEKGEVYIVDLEEYIDPVKELVKKSSRLAYSNRTRRYLRKRSLRNLAKYGEWDDLNYVRMATGLLLAYDNERDYTEPFSTSNYEYVNGRYQKVEKQYPANANAIYLNQILFGNAKNMRLEGAGLWMFVDENKNPKPGKRQNQEPGQSSEGFFKKIISLFTGKKKEPEQKASYAESPQAQQQKQLSRNDAPYIHLWNQLPQAYIQLLIDGRMNEIHQFAVSNLQAHPDYAGIKEKLDHTVIEPLLASVFDIPVDFAYKLALEKYDPLHPDTGLVKALLYSRLPAARETAVTWVTDTPDLFFNNTEWVAALLFCPHADIRKWIAEKLSSRSYTPAQAELISGRVMAKAMSTKQNSELNNTIIEEAGETIIRLFHSQLKDISLNIAEDLVKSQVAASQVLGLKILLLKKGVLNYDNISSEVFSSLFSNANHSVREKSFDLLQELSNAELLRRQELIIHCCISSYHDVRVGIRPVMTRMADTNPEFGVSAVNYLAPYLLRKETSEGLQKDISDLLKNELIAFVKDADKEMVLRLVYSQYIPAQEFGIVILEKYIDPSTFTIRQIIALGNHETLAIREWCWKYFSTNASRIKFEREESIRLLDAKWDDTREFAKAFFRDNFSANDWSPETLVGIADSIRPDIEAYGRELITKFFTDTDGEQYLLKLSQHPGEKMQLFATNYLERFAGGNTERIEGLTFYFRSVLSRVNKARVAKNRVFQFLLKEGKQSEATAKIIAQIITAISATVSIEDKAKCIEIMYELNRLYQLDLPIVVQEAEERNY